MRSNVPSWRVLTATAALAALTLTLMPAEAPAQAAEFGVIEDEGLAACINTALGDRPAGDEITADDLLALPQQFKCFSGPGVRSFAGFEGATRVLSITLTGAMHEISTPDALTPLRALPRLSTLTMTDVQVTDAGLGGLAAAGDAPPTLRNLTIVNAPALIDPAPLEHIGTLERLTLTSLPALSDITALSVLVNLTELDLSANGTLSGIAPLSSLTQLSDLNLNQTQVSDLAAIAGLTELRKLSVSNTRVASLAPLRDLTKIQQLSADNAKLTSLAGLEHLADLRILLASNNSIVGDVAALAGKPLLSTLQLDRNRITSVAALAQSTALTFVDLWDNRISSLVGLPESASGMTLRVTSQNFAGPEQFVPEGATSFRVDAAGQVTLRDGTTFPELAHTGSAPADPTPDPDLPLLRFTKFAGDNLRYAFNGDSAATQFSGNVTMPITWSRIESSPATDAAVDVPFTHQVTVTQGFPAHEYSLGTDAPAWLRIDPATGLLSGTAPDVGQFAVQLRAADALGNTVTQEFVITVAALADTTVSIGPDQSVAAGTPLTFTVSRADAAVDPWTGESSVTVATHDGTAVSGTDYRAIETRLVWNAGDSADKTVEVQTLTPKTKPGISEKTLTLRLSQPGAHTALGDRAVATGTITENVAVTPPTGTGGGNSAGGGIATTGTADGPFPWLLSGGALLAAGAAALITRTRRRSRRS